MRRRLGGDVRFLVGKQARRVSDKRAVDTWATAVDERRARSGARFERRRVARAAYAALRS